MLNAILAALDDSESSFEFTPAVLRSLTGADMDTLMAAMLTRGFSRTWCMGLVSDWHQAKLPDLIIPIPDGNHGGDAAELAILERQDRRYEE